MGVSKCTSSLGDKGDREEEVEKELLEDTIFMKGEEEKTKDLVAKG